MGKTIEEISSKHLGKAGDGTVVKPYVTPDSVDTELLVGVPRYMNRESYGIDNNTFSGFDVWFGYEVSCLMQNGMPLNFVARIEYPSTSTCIVESKSLKLYLNSYNLMKFSGSVGEITNEISNKIAHDLETYANTGKTIVDLQCLIGKDYRKTVDPQFKVKELEELVLDGIADVEFNKYTESPELLKLINEDADEVIHSYSLRSNCRVTNQPDWGDVVISYKASKKLDLEQLMQYIVSMRKEAHYHEEICECIYFRLKELFGENLESLTVMCLYTVRGGISINPIRTSGNDYKFESLVDFYTRNGYRPTR